MSKKKEKEEQVTKKIDFGYQPKKPDIKPIPPKRIKEDKTKDKKDE